MPCLSSVAFRFAPLFSLALLVACQATPGGDPSGPLPVAPAGPALPTADTQIQSLLIASCLNEESRGPIPVLKQMSQTPADMVLMVGDNVYGDIDRGRYVKADSALSELQRSFAELASRDDFTALRGTHPMMVAWDDHDYGRNNAGGEFPYKARAEQLHETFWSLGDEAAGQHAGTYYNRIFGPAGDRVQVIVLDTRYFRLPRRRGAAAVARFVMCRARRPTRTCWGGRNGHGCPDNCKRTLR
jgi:alkaline phosphatase D